MKHIFHSAFDLLVMAFCGAWIFYGIEGAGNIFKVWVWFGAILTACMLAGLKWIVGMKIKTRVPMWREVWRCMTYWTMAAVLIWRGEILAGLLILFMSLGYFVISTLTEFKESA